MQGLLLKACSTLDIWGGPQVLRQQEALCGLRALRFIKNTKNNVVKQANKEDRQGGHNSNITSLLRLPSCR